MISVIPARFCGPGNEGAQIQEGYKSMAYSVVFRSREKTLEEQEVAAAMKKILNGLSGMGIELRQ